MDIFYNYVCFLLIFLYYFLLFFNLLYKNNFNDNINEISINKTLYNIKTKTYYDIVLIMQFLYFV